MSRALSYLQGDAMNNIHGVDDVPQRFAHLPAVFVPHQGMKENLMKRTVKENSEQTQNHSVIMFLARCVLLHLFERQAASELSAQHHHPGHPEEDQVAARLQQGVGVEALEVSSLCTEPGFLWLRTGVPLCSMFPTSQ